MCRAALRFRVTARCAPPAQPAPRFSESAKADAAFPHIQRARLDTAARAPPAAPVCPDSRPVRAGYLRRGLNSRAHRIEDFPSRAAVPYISIRLPLLQEKWAVLPASLR